MSSLLPASSLSHSAGERSLYAYFVDPFLVQDSTPGRLTWQFLSDVELEDTVTRIMGFWSISRCADRLGFSHALTLSMPPPLLAIIVAFFLRPSLISVFMLDSTFPPPDAYVCPSKILPDGSPVEPPRGTCPRPGSKRRR